MIVVHAEKKKDRIDITIPDSYTGRFYVIRYKHTHGSREDSDNYVCDSCHYLEPDVKRDISYMQVRKKWIEILLARKGSDFKDILERGLASLDSE